MTQEKIFNFLLFLQESFRNEQSLSISTLCKINKVPTEYGTWAVGNGLMKVKGGKRGACTHVWDHTKPPTIELAQKLIEKYNASRRETNKRIFDSNTQALRRIEEELAVIKQLLLEKNN